MIRFCFAVVVADKYIFFVCYAFVSAQKGASPLENLVCNATSLKLPLAITRNKVSDAAA